MAKIRVGDQVRVSKHVMGRDYHAQGEVTRVFTDRIGREYCEVEGDYWETEGDGFENFIEVIAAAADPQPEQPEDAQCRLCGEIDGEMEPVKTTWNVGEDGQPDPGGCFSHSRIEWRCADHQQCRQNRREMAKLLREQARWSDMEAREMGRGGRIGGGF